MTCKIIVCTFHNVKLMMMTKDVTHEHHILWSAPISLLSHGTFLYCIFVLVHCIILMFCIFILFLYLYVVLYFCICTLYIVLCGDSHECICGNNHNQMDFLIPVGVTWTWTVVIGIKIMMVRVVNGNYDDTMFMSMLIIMVMTRNIIWWYNYNTDYGSHDDIHYHMIGLGDNVIWFCWISVL